MQCPKCQFENPQDSNFCLECGQKLEKICPRCEKGLPAGAKFCNGRGHRLEARPTPFPKEFSFEEKLDKTLTVQKSEGFRVKAPEGEVVVLYFEPSATQNLKPSGFPVG